jgi:hypothetical protein
MSVEFRHIGSSAIDTRHKQLHTKMVSVVSPIDMGHTRYSLPLLSGAGTLRLALFRRVVLH